MLNLFHRKCLYNIIMACDIMNIYIVTYHNSLRVWEKPNLDFTLFIVVVNLMVMNVQ